MTKKDYILIAKALEDTQPDPQSYSPFDDNEGFNRAFDQWDKVCKALADRLAQDNPRFQRARFLRACGYDAPEAAHELA